MFEYHTAVVEYVDALFEVYGGGKDYITLE
jgi:hypothetical protein